MSRDIIEAIDGALEDWAVSEDAMRWTPDPPEVEPSTSVSVSSIPLLWVPSVADPAAPTVDELSRGVDLDMHLEYGGHDFTPPVEEYWVFGPPTAYWDRASREWVGDDPRRP